jgi:hypothetical protein
MRAHRSLPVTVSRLPYRSEEQEALLRVASALSRLWPGVERALIFWCAVFHVGAALTLALYPFDQLLTEGTRPVFALASRYVWAVLFACGAAGVLAVLRWRRPAIHAAIWIGVFSIGGGWFAPMLLAVLHGAGAPMGLWVWFVLYGPFALGAITYALKNR